jgi:hypothetical protein
LTFINQTMHYEVMPSQVNLRSSVMAKSRRWFLILCLMLACIALPACGGDGEGGTVTGDSPEGISVDSGLEEPATEGGQAVPDGSDLEADVDENLTDGQ